MPDFFSNEEHKNNGKMETFHSDENSYGWNSSDHECLLYVHTCMHYTENIHPRSAHSWNSEVGPTFGMVQILSAQVCKWTFSDIIQPIVFLFWRQAFYMSP